MEQRKSIQREMIKVLNEMTKHTIPIDELKKIVESQQEDFTFRANKDDFITLNPQIKDDIDMYATTVAIMKNAKFYMKSEAYEKTTLQNGEITYPDSKLRETGFIINLKNAINDFLESKERLSNVDLSKYSQLQDDLFEVQKQEWNNDPYYEDAYDMLVDKYGDMLKSYHQIQNNRRETIKAIEYVYLRDKETDDIIEGTSRSRGDINYDIREIGISDGKSKIFSDYAWPRGDTQLNANNEMDKIDAIANALYEFIAYPPSEIKNALIENINKQSLQLPIYGDTLSTYFTLAKQVQQANHEMERTAAALIIKNGTFIRDVVEFEKSYMDSKYGEMSFMINPQKMINEFDKMRELLTTDRKISSPMHLTNNKIVCNDECEVIDQYVDRNTYTIENGWHNDVALISMNKSIEEREKPELLTVLEDNDETFFLKARLTIDWHDKALAEMILTELEANPKYEYAHTYREDDDSQKIQMEFTGDYEFKIDFKNMTRTEYDDLCNIVNAALQEYQSKDWETCAEEYVKKEALPPDVLEIVKEEYKKELEEDEKFWENANWDEHTFMDDYL